jgi:predicted small lipoprotein YifL
MRVTFRAAVFIAMVGLTGCGSGGPKTYPVRGRVAIPNGDVAVLAGSTVEAALDADPTVRAAGTIEPDGSFRLETLQAGVIKTGAVAGTYKVRVILTDDDPAMRKQAAKALHPKALKFESSGLTLQVPAPDEVRLELAARP